MGKRALPRCTRRIVRQNSHNFFFWQLVQAKQDKRKTWKKKIIEVTDERAEKDFKDGCRLSLASFTSFLRVW